MIFQKELIRCLKSNAEKTAILRGDESLSFNKLFLISNKITKILLDRQLGKETIIGIQLTDRIELIAAVIGILNAGCAFVLLNPEIPKNRLVSMINDLNLKHLILSSNDGFLYDNNVNGLNYYYFEELTGSAVEALIEPDEYPDFQAQDSIYVYFTSGSSGQPKGIVGKSCSLLQFIKWEIEEFCIDDTYRVSQLISPYFDAFMRDIFVPLLSGGTICIPPDDEDFFLAEKLTSWIDESGINLIHCVPSVFRVLNSNLLSSEKFVGLKYILLSGEKIILADLVDWYQVFGDRIQLVNLYGTTETTMIRSFYRIRQEDTKRVKIPIGGPISKTILLVAKDDFKPAGALISGDLYIISDYNSKGYLNAPELTHEKFIKYKAEGSAETIAFKTGDRARKLANGEIDLIGREDRQIKLGGVRIEPEEIETVLVQSKLVRHAVVLNQWKENGNESLVGFVIKEQSIAGGLSLKRALTAYMKAHLPTYMIPPVLIEVSEYPLLSNGKINYKELLNIQSSRKIFAPENETEAQLLLLWREVLGSNPISVEDTFHSLGGNSMAIIRLMSSIIKTFNVKITLNDIFNNLTIKKQADFILKSGKNKLLLIPKAVEKRVYNLSSAQERMYYHHQLNKESTAFNLPMTWELNGVADVGRIEKVIRLLIERHESLRTAFVIEGGSILQKVERSVDFSLQELVAENSDVASAIDHFVKPFDLNIAPLIRSAILFFPEISKKILIVDMHHIVCDGMSQKKLFTEFIGLYNGDVMKPLDIQYKDYAEWEYNYKRLEEYISHREFWLKAFEENIPKLNLPVIGLSERNTLSDKGGDLVFNIERSILNPVIEAFKEQNITTFSGLLSIYFMFLSQLTGNEDIAVGVVSSGRIQKEIEGVVGMFAKTLPIRFKVNPHLYFRDFLVELHQYFVQANSRQSYDLIDIIGELNANKPKSVENLFETIFVFQNFENIHSYSPDEMFSMCALESKTAKYPISLVVTEGDEAFDFALNYSLDYFTYVDVVSLADQFRTLINRLSENMDAKIIDYIGVNKQLSHFEDDDISFNF